MPRLENTCRGLQGKNDGRDGTIPLTSKGIGVAVQVSFTRLAVRAGVFKRDQISGFGAEHANLFAKHHDLLQIARDLMIPGGDIPSVLQKHLRGLLNQWLRILAWPDQGQELLIPVILPRCLRPKGPASLQ